MMKAKTKKTFSRTALTLSLLSGVALFAGSPLGAEPVQIPATANWAIHFDLQSFGQTPLAEAIDARRKSDEEKQLLALAAGVIGFDFEQDLDAVTLYGPDKNPVNAVLQIQGRFERGKVEGYLAGRPSFLSNDHQGHKILQWEKESGESLFAHPGAMAFHPSGKAVLAASPGTVGEALDLLDGRADSLSLPVPPDAADPYFMAFANLKDIGDLGHQAALLQHSNQIVVALGQTNDRVSARVTLRTDSLEAARQIQAVLQGIQAYALLQSAGNGAGIPDWLLATTVVREDSTLFFFLDTPTDTILSLIHEHFGTK